MTAKPSWLQVELKGGANPLLLEGLPETFNVADELYLMQMLDLPRTKLLLTTNLTEKEARVPDPYGFKYDGHPALEGYEPQGARLCLGFERKLGPEDGRGAVVYIGLGHCHPEGQPGQPFVHESANPGGMPKGPPEHVETPHPFQGPWNVKAFEQLMQNAIKWGLDQNATSSSKL